ncbi:MAG: NTP transferase domain-containing protein, partial [Pseudomonadota bacterium]
KKSPLEGEEPMLIHILKRLPPGPKGVVINYKKDDIINATRSFQLTYCEQPVLNGTGGALLASRSFLEAQDLDHLIITMGDVPLIRTETFLNLIQGLRDHGLMILAFQTTDKRQYGVLEIHGNEVSRIIEWKYWKTYPEERQEPLQICNSGIYAASKKKMLSYLSILEKRPHIVSKERDGKIVQLEEYFLTDLVELMHKDGVKTGYMIVPDEDEVMGVDDLTSLIKAQNMFRKTTFER